MLESLQKNWLAYLMEAAGLGGFVALAGLVTIFLEHPDFPIKNLVTEDYAILRRVPLGLVMGAYIALIIFLFGERSGAHLNPAATWTFFRLGKINFTNAVFYTLAQFAGAIAGAHLLKYALNDYLAHPLIKFGVTEPKPPHTATEAFVAEFIISFVLLAATLFAASRKGWKKSIAWLTGALIAVYLVFETPYSGMSLNPARSFAASLAANEWRHLWIYFVAPVLAMLLAAELYRQIRSKFKTFFDTEPPVYPVEKTME